MRIRLLLRAFFTFTTLAVVWFVTSPALASTPPALSSLLADAERVDDSVPPSSRAPLCDPRGATMFAPPPQMQDVELTIDTGLTLDDCLASHRNPTSPTHASRGRTPLPIDATASGDSATDRVVAAMLAAAGRELIPVPAASTSCLRPGVRSTVDRPPRA